MGLRKLTRKRRFTALYLYLSSILNYHDICNIEWSRPRWFSLQTCQIVAVAYQNHNHFVIALMWHWCLRSRLNIILWIFSIFSSSAPLSPPNVWACYHFRQLTQCIITSHWVTLLCECIDLFAVNVTYFAEVICNGYPNAPLTPVPDFWQRRT